MASRITVASRKTATARAKPSIFINTNPPSMKAAEHRDHHRRGARDHGTRARDALHDRLVVAPAEAPLLAHAGHEEDLVVHAQAEHRAEHEGGNDGKDPVDRPLQAEEPHPVAVLEDEHQGAERGAPPRGG